MNGRLARLGAGGALVLSLAAVIAIGQPDGDPSGGLGDQSDDDGKVTPPANDVRELHDRFGPLTMLAGNAYEIDGAWLDGTPILARNEYRADLDGQTLVSKVYTQNPNGETNQRYFTVWTADPATGELTAYGVTFDGSADSTGAERDESADGDPVLRSRWSVDTPAGAVQMRQEVEIEDGGESYAWRVWSKSPGADEWRPMMDGRWEKVGEVE